MALKEKNNNKKKKEDNGGSAKSTTVNTNAAQQAKTTNTSQPITHAPVQYQSIPVLANNTGKSAPYTQNYKPVPSLKKASEINGYDRNIPQIANYQNTHRSRYKNNTNNTQTTAYKAADTSSNELNTWKTQNNSFEKQENALTVQIAKATSQEERDALADQLDSINKQRRALNKPIGNEVDRYLQDGYKLNSEEKKRAKQIVNDYYKTEYKAFDKNWNDEKQKKFDQMVQLENKTSAGAAFMQGIADAMPGTKTIEKTAAKETGSDPLQEAREDANTQNKAAVTAGNLIGQFAKYRFGADAAGLIPVLGKAAETAGTALSKIPVLNKVGAEHITNVLGDTALDVALDTIPEAIGNAQDGKSTSEIAKDAVKNVGTNLGFNVAGEAVGVGLNKLGKAIGNKVSAKQAQKAVDNVEPIAKQATGIEQLSKAGNMPDNNVQTYIDKPQTKPNVAPTTNTNPVPVLKKETPTPTMEQRLSDWQTQNQHAWSDTVVNQQAHDTAKYKIDEMMSSIDRTLRLYDDGTDRTTIRNELADALYNLVDNPDFANDTTIDKVIETASKLNESMKNTKYKSKRYKTVSAYDNDIAKTVSQEMDSLYDNIFKAYDYKMIDNAAQSTPTRPRTVSESVQGNPTLTEDISSDDLWNELEQGDLTQQSKQLGRSFSLNDNSDAVYKTSQTATNTFRNSDLYQDQRYADMVESDIKSGRFDFESVSHEKAYARAGEDIAKDPIGETQRLLNRDWTNGSEDVAKAHLIKEQALESGDMQTLGEMAWKMAQQGHNFGQGLEAFKTFSNKYTVSPEGAVQAYYDAAFNQTQKWIKKNKQESIDMQNISNTLSTAINTVDDISQIKQTVSDMLSSKKSTKKLAKNDELVTSVAQMLADGKNSDAIYDFLTRYESIGINYLDEDTANYVMQRVGEAEKLGDSKARAEIMDEVYLELANHIAKTSVFEKINSWRYMCMLSSPTTHIANIAGNTANYILHSASRNIQSVLESIAKVDNKTSSVLNVLNGNDRDLLKQSRNYITNDAYSVFKGDSRMNVQAGIESNKKIFKNKAVEAARNFESNTLDAEDWAFIKLNGSEYLASYLKANGADASIFNATDEGSQKLLREAADYASQKAKEATYHEASKLAEFMGHWRKTAEDGGIIAKAGYTAANTTIPFASMTENYVKEGLRYSPLQAVKAVGEMAVPKLRQGMTTSDVLEDMAQGLTGTASVALGIALASCGILNNSGSDDEEQQAFDELQGKQPYSLNLSFGGKDYTYTVDGLLGSGGMAIMLGANAYKYLRDEGLSLNDIVTTASQLADPFIEQSFVSSINDLLTQIKYAPDGEELSTILATSASNFATQFTPTVGKRVANAINRETKTSYSGKTGMANTAAKTGYKLINSIPVLGQAANVAGDFLAQFDNSALQGVGNYLQNANQPYLNAWGEHNNVPGDNLGSRLAYQLGSKGFLQEYSTSDIEAALQNVKNNAQSDVSVFPTVPSSKVTIDGVERKLEPREYTAYQESVGNYEKEILTSFIQSDFYKNGDADSQAEAIGTIYKFSKALATNELFGQELTGTNKSLYDLYDRYGGEGISCYFNADHLAKTDPDNKTNKGEDRGLASSTAMKQYQYLTQSGMSDEQAGDYLYQSEASDSECALYEEYGGGALGQYYDFKANTLNEKGKTDSAIALYTLANMGNMSDELKGAYYRTACSVQLEKDGKNTKAGKVYNDLGDGGLFRYYMYKEQADFDGNGNLNQKEITYFLNNQDMTRSERNYWYDMMSSNSKKNPY